MANTSAFPDKSPPMAHASAFRNESPRRPSAASRSTSPRPAGDSYRTPARRFAASGSAARRGGLTLLELLLALSLSVLILAAVGMAIDLQLRTLETRRTYLEEAQLARAVLRMIADDLRSSVRHQPQDFSAVEQMLASAAGEAVEEALGALEGAGDGEAGGGEAGGAGGGGANPIGDGMGGDPLAGGDLDLDAADAADPMVQEEDPATTDIASTVEPPPVPGLYGNAYELQVDVSRLPRLDEFRYQSGSASNAIGSLVPNAPSDVRTVAWYVQGASPLGGAAPAAGNSAAGNSALGGPAAGGAQAAGSSLVLGEFGQATSGLVRRELGRSVTRWAVDNGTTQTLQGAGELLAPEVTAIQFQYFDGYTWYPEWNSDQMGGLPLAVEITLFMQPRDAVDEAGQPTLDPTLLEQSSAGIVQGLLVYRLVVRLPAAQPAMPAESSDLEALGL